MNILFLTIFINRYDGRTFKTESKEKAERSKLLHRYKREMKSAVREIRKDNSFLSKLKYHEQAKRYEKHFYTLSLLINVILFSINIVIIF